MNLVVCAVCNTEWSFSKQSRVNRKSDIIATIGELRQKCSLKESKMELGAGRKKKNNIDGRKKKNPGCY